jgi:thiol:disulfide interchange protein
MNRILLVILVLGFHAASAGADDADNLLPVEQAFKVQAKAIDRESARVDFTIANDYYLYRERIKVKSLDANVTLGALDLPAGEKKHDEFLGDVEVYHRAFTATQHFTAPANVENVALELRYQGCHQVDPKICFPPQKVALSILLPKAVDAATPVLAATPGSLLGNAPLPAEQAFVFEAIATGSNEILARFTMPKGY